MTYYFDLSPGSLYFLINPDPILKVTNLALASADVSGWEMEGKVGLEESRRGKFAYLLQAVAHLILRGIVDPLEKRKYNISVCHCTP